MSSSDTARSSRLVLRLAPANHGAGSSFGSVVVRCFAVCARRRSSSWRAPGDRAFALQTGVALYVSCGPIRRESLGLAAVVVLCSGAQGHGWSVCVTYVAGISWRRGKPQGRLRVNGANDKEGGPTHNALRISGTVEAQANRMRGAG